MTDLALSVCEGNKTPFCSDGSFPILRSIYVLVAFFPMCSSCDLSSSLFLHPALLLRTIRCCLRSCVSHLLASATVPYTLWRYNSNATSGFHVPVACVVSFLSGEQQCCEADETCLLVVCFLPACKAAAPLLSADRVHHQLPYKANCFIIRNFVQALAAECFASQVRQLCPSSLDY